MQSIRMFAQVSAHDPVPAVLRVRLLARAERRVHRH